MSAWSSNIIFVGFSIKLHINKKVLKRDLILFLLPFSALIWKRDKSENFFLTQTLRLRIEYFKGTIKLQIHRTNIPSSRLPKRKFLIFKKREEREFRKPQKRFTVRELFKHLINRFSRVNLSRFLKISSDGNKYFNKAHFPFFPAKSANGVGKNVLKNLRILKGDGPFNRFSIRPSEDLLKKWFFYCFFFCTESFCSRQTRVEKIIKLDYINIALSMGSLCFFPVCE